MAEIEVNAGVLFAEPRIKTRHKRVHDKTQAGRERADWVWAGNKRLENANKAVINKTNVPTVFPFFKVRLPPVPPITNIFMAVAPLLGRL
jgi:hypothetical protein